MFQLQLLVRRVDGSSVDERVSDACEALRRQGFEFDGISFMADSKTWL